MTLWNSFTHSPGDKHVPHLHKGTFLVYRMYNISFKFNLFLQDKHYTLTLVMYKQLNRIIKPVIRVHYSDNTKNAVHKSSGLLVWFQGLIVNNSLNMWHRGKCYIANDRKMLPSMWGGMRNF